MSKSNKLVKTEGSITIPTSQKEVPATIEALKAQLATLKGDIKNEISIDIDYNGQNIKNIEKVSELLAISASIKARSKAYREEVVAFGLEGKIEDFKQTDKTAEEWDQILKKAVTELINSSQIKKLENAIEKLSKHLDQETKLKMELESIVGDASKLLA